MNEEERKAVEILNTFELRRKTKNYKEISLEDSQSAEIVLNLIEKLQKENEKLKNKLLDILEGQKVIKENYISKQKVKDKIEKEIKYHEKNILDIENITIFKSKTAKEEAEIEFNKYAIVVLNKMLQELIEEREEK